MTNEQAVDQTDTEDQGSGNEEEVAQDKTAADYLAEFDESEEPTGETQKDSKPEYDENLAKQVHDLTAAQLKAKEDEKEAIAIVKGELKVPDDMIKTYLTGLVGSDEKVKNAWLNRHKNPKAWDGFLKSQNNEFAALFVSDSEATETRKKVTSAIKASSTTTASESKDVWGMSSDEFEKNAQSELRKALGKT